MSELLTPVWLAAVESLALRAKERGDVRPVVELGPAASLVLIEEVRRLQAIERAARTVYLSALACTSLRDGNLVEPLRLLLYPVSTHTGEESEP